MTRDCKKQLLKTWQTIGKLRQALERQMVAWLDGKNREGYLQVLEEYQQAVITVGNTIEHCAEEAESKGIIPGLEQYCEEIYLMVDRTDTPTNYRRQMETLRREHRQLSELLEKLPEKTEVLFLPYKFSMWDSLESVYFAAAEDEQCKAVVMPIPYIEQGADNNKQWHYEGGDFQGIPIVSFQEYDIAEHRPDVIFIHNPYDGFNMVTSVAPDYYSSELKAYCRLLVYIPYFYTGAPMPNIHLNLFPYANMDYIVVPSHEAVEQMSPYVPKEKLLPLGSPKIDRMLLMNQKREMPLEWKRQIRGRKAVLYNVGISGLLQNGFRTIFKMRYVFDYFKKHSDLVLWWRPHPLLKSTIKSMRPELLAVYEEMERAFLLERIGIYDVTPDSNMAIAATDAFLGDYSSMVCLYGIMGKPIFLTDNFSMTEPEESERRQIWMAGGIRESSGDMIFYSPDYHTVCRLDLESGEIEFLYQMDGNYAGGQVFYAGIPEKSEIRFFPIEKGRPVIVYHMADQSFTQEEPPENGLLYTHYGAVWEEGDEMILCPGIKPEFVFWDRATGEIGRYQDFEEELRVYSQLPNETLLVGAVRIGQCVYSMSYRVNKMLEFDLTNGRWRLLDMGEEEIRFSSFVYDGKDFWLLAWDGSCIVRWKKEGQKAEKYARMPEGFLGMSSSMASQYTPAFGGVVLLEEELLVFPHIANMILKVNRRSGEISEWRPQLFYEEGQRKSSLYNRSSNYSFICQYDERRILAQTSYDGSLLMIDIETGEVVSRKCVLSAAEYEKLDNSVEKSAFRSQVQSPYYYQEDGMHLSLGDMMHYLSSGQDLQEKRQIEASTEGVENVDGSCGRKVYESVIGALGGRTNAAVKK